MQNLRKYGHRPFDVAVIHGGPGAPGEMAPVARQLSSVRGVLEPFQTEATIEGQIQELKAVLETHSELPVTLIGFSWGAMLTFIFTARHPSFVKKLILIGSGVYEERYAVDLMKTRLNRLDEEEREEAVSAIEKLNSSSVKNKNALMARFGELMSRADSYDPLPYKDEILEYQYGIYQNIWSEARELRSNGRFLELGKSIRCPVVSIHGDYDPHLSAGIKEPLSRALKDFRFILLKECGHCPWIERRAKDSFYRILKDEI